MFWTEIIALVGLPWWLRGFQYPPPPTPGVTRKNTSRHCFVSLVEHNPLVDKNHCVIVSLQ